MAVEGGEVKLKAWVSPGGSPLSKNTKGEPINRNTEGEEAVSTMEVGVEGEVEIGKGFLGTV